MTQIVNDTFTRTVAAGGVGTADTGQVWTVSAGAAAQWSVNGSAALVAANALNTRFQATLNTVSLYNVDVRFNVSTPVVAAGAAIQAHALLRHKDFDNYYNIGLEFRPDGKIWAVIEKRLAGVNTVLNSGVDTGITYATGTVYRIRAQAYGSQLRVRVWNNSLTEPTTWHALATDTSITTAGAVGMRSFVKTGNTNTLPVTLTIDNFAAFDNPVTITATQQNSWPPRVLVSVTDLGIGDAVELYRVVGGVRTLVRDGTLASTVDTSFLRVDAEEPFGVPVSYVARVNYETEFSTTATTYALPGGKVAVTDAINGNAAETVILAWDEKARQRQATVFKVGGRNVVVSGDMGMFEGTVELFVETTSSRDNLAAALEDATEGVIQIRQPGGYDGVDSYLAVLGMRERRHSQDGSDQRRIFALDVAEVEGWAPLLEARGYTLQDIANIYPDPLTLTDLSNNYATLLAVAQGDFSA